MDLYERFFESAPDAVLLVDAAGRITRANGQAEAMFGRARSEMTGAPLDALIPDFRMDGDADAPPSAESWIEMSGQSADGREFPVGLIRGTPGAEGLRVCVVRDISDRVRLQNEALSLLEAVPNGMVIANAAGTIVLANTCAENLFGYSRNELVGQPVELLIPERFRSIHAAHVQACLTGGQAGSTSPGAELAGRRNDGTEFPVEIHLSPMETEGGPLVASSIRDLSEQKRSQEKVARLAAIVDFAADGIIGKDLNGIIHSWNPGAERLFGYPAAEAFGRHISLIIPPDLLHEEAELLARIRRGEKVDSYGSVRRRKDGTFVEVWLTVSPVMDPEGNVIGASKIARDVTERRQADQRVLDALRDRELLLKEIHHRVKNNLTVIGSLFYLQSTYAKDEHTTSVLRDCQDRVRSMALVHDRFYHSDNFAKVDFAEYAEELANQLVRNYALTPGAIRLNFEVERISLAVDQAVPCGLILNELVANSIKHAFPLGRAGVITVGLMRNQAGQVTLSVADDGIGLPDDAALEASRSLGMHLITSLARQLDARIAFNRLDPGTNVSLTLPP